MSLQISNQFATLQVQDPTVASRGDPAPAAAPTSPTDQPSGLSVGGDNMIYEAESMAAGAEEQMALWLLFQDTNNLQEIVLQHLASYVDGNLPFVAVAATADYAIKLVQKLEEDYLEEFPNAHNSGTLQDRQVKAFLMRCSSYQPKRHLGSFSVSSFDSPDYDYQVWSYMTTSLSLSYSTKSSAALLRDPEMPCERTIPLTDNNEPTFMAETRLLDDIMPIFQFLNDIKLDMLWQDSLTEQLRLFLQTREETLALLFGVQCFIEFHRVLQTAVEEPFHHLVQVAAAIKKDAQELIEYQRGSSSFGWPEELYEGAREVFVERVDACILQDAIHKCMFGRLKQKDTQTLSRLPPAFHFYKRHPLLCGVITLALQTSMTEFGTTSASCNPAAERTAHLYHAIMSEHDKEPQVGRAAITKWPAMDQFIRLHKPQIFGTDAAPSDTQQSRLRFLLSSGASVSNLAPNPHGRIGKHGRARTDLESPCPLQSQYTCCLGGQTAQESFLSRTYGLLNSMFIGSDHREGNTTNVYVSRREGDSSKHSRLNVHQAVIALAYGIARETREGTLNYTVLQLECDEYLKKLSRLPECNMCLERVGPASSGKQPVWGVVAVVLNEAAGRDKDAMLRGEWKSGQRSTSELLENVGRWTDVWLKVRDLKEKKQKGST